VVVTPFSPTDWKLTFDGETVSLHPSIGNWSFKCRSHYWIRENEVHWAARWTDEDIEAGRQRDRVAKSNYFRPRRFKSTSQAPQSGAVTKQPSAGSLSMWSRVTVWLKSLLQDCL
jgi:Family of unknown function (DUF6527)